MTRAPEPGGTPLGGMQPDGTAGAARHGGAATAPVRVTDRCAGCGACLLTCPQRAIRPVGGTLLVRPGLCDGCGECVEVCPVDAIDEVPYVDALAASGRTAPATTALAPSSSPSSPSDSPPSNRSSGGPR